MATSGIAKILEWGGVSKKIKPSNHFIICYPSKKKYKNTNYDINIVNAKQTKKSITMAIFQQFYIDYIIMII